MKRLFILLVLLTFVPVGLFSAWSHEYRDPASGVRVICGTEPGMFPSHWVRGRIRGKATALQRVKAMRMLRLIKQELKKYPVAFLRHHLKRVYILKNIYFFGLSYGGTYYTSTRTVYVIAASSNYFRQLFHAEFSSIIYKKNQNDFPTSSWKQANSPDFSYGKGGRNALRGGRSSTQFSSHWHKKGLLYQYGSASVEEDINSYARNIFAAKKGFWKIVSQYPRVARKVRLISRFYGKLHSRFTLKYFRSLSRNASRYSMPADNSNPDRNSGDDQHDPDDASSSTLGFTGRWQSSYGTLVLQRRGSRITGSYGYRDGKIIGTLRGRRLDFLWIEKGGKSQGKGYFILSQSGDSFHGKWGYRNSSTNGGRWTGRRVR